MLTENLRECQEESLELLLAGVPVVLKVGADLLVVVEGVVVVALRVVVGGHDVEALNRCGAVDSGGRGQGAANKGAGAQDKECSVHLGG